MTANEHQLFRLKPAGYQEKFDNHNVKFVHESAGEKLNITGKFVVHRIEGFEFVDLHVNHRLYPSDPPYTYWVFHLQQPYVDAIAPINDPDPELRFELKLPLRQEDCIFGELKN